MILFAVCAVSQFVSSSYRHQDLHSNDLGFWTGSYSLFFDHKIFLEPSKPTN